MSRPRSPSGGYNIQRIRVGRDGYDASGAYWGAGPDVFIATSADGADQVTVRARTTTAARAGIDAELTRRPGESRKDANSLGGAAPRKTTYEITWTDPVGGEAVRIRITHARDYLASGTDHIEVESIRPRKAPLPITESGYRSHFLSPRDLINAGGPLTFVTAWIAREAKSKAWLKSVSVAAQGDLFQWAEAADEAGGRKPKPKRSQPKPRRRRGRNPAQA